MTPETAKKLLPVITAWSEGKDIQARTPGTGASGWETPTMPSFREDLEWRIKPREPREFWACWNKDADLDDPENELRLYEQKQADLSVGRQQIKLREILTDETQ